MRRAFAWTGTCLLAQAGVAWGNTIDQVTIESWSGTGQNTVLLVVDFWPGNGATDSFAFGYRFDGPSISGLDLLNGVAAGGTGLAFAETGGFVTDFWYDTGSAVYHTGSSWPDSWWSYWISDDFGETWGFGPAPADRVLMDGDTDGWLAKPGSDSTSEPVTPIPEPGAGAVLVLGAVTLPRRRR